MTSVYALFVLSCPRCRSEELRRRADHVGCVTCGAWVFRIVGDSGGDMSLVELLSELRHISLDSRAATPIVARAAQ